MRVTVAAPAKVNLWLRVGPRAPSGFHPLDTLFCSLNLADSVMVRPGTGALPTLELTHARPLTRSPDLGPPESNLAVRAARAFQERAGLETGPEIRLIKRIPPGAGLGGGSSDAAAVLRAMARLHPGTLSGPELLGLGAELGSDVPFFVQGAPLARGTGRGERLTPLPAAPTRAVVVAAPGFPVATREAYGWLDQDRGDEPGRDFEPDPLPDRVGWELVAERAINDFEPPVFHRHPQLQAMRDHLRDHGARPALLAGSGSTVFGVFESRDAARDAASSLRDADPDARVIVTRTRTR